MSIAAYAIAQAPIAARLKTARTPRPPASRQIVAKPDVTAAPEPR